MRRHLFPAILLACVATLAHAQRVTDLDFSAVAPSGIGCIYPRCFSSVPAVDGDTLITVNLGAGVLVRTSPGAWTLQQTLWNPDGMPTLQYPNPMGEPAALRGDTLLLTGTSRKYNNKPVIYVWQRSGAAWSHTQVLALPRTAGYDTTDVHSVVLNGRFAAVCGERHDFAYTRRLIQIDIFARQADGRFQRQTQLNPAVSSGDENNSECMLGLEGNTLIVGDPMANAGAGRVHIYERGASGWILRKRLAAADATPDARFGDSIAISGNTIAVGAARRPNFDAPLHLGAVYVFQRTAESWAQVQILVKPEFEQEPPSHEELPSEFGGSVALSGDRLATDWSDFDGAMPLGYLYERRGVWAPVAGFNHEPGTYTGSVHLSGTVATVGVSDGHSGAGTVIYELPPLWTLPPRVESP
jgi:hypothetical protein